MNPDETIIDRSADGRETLREDDAGAAKRGCEKCGREAVGESEGEGRREKGCVYFIETHDGAFVKIGFSIDVPQRLEQIGVQMPGLRLIGHIPGTFATERWLHAKFASYRERGEWFRRARDIDGFIWNIGLIGPPPRTEQTSISSSDSSIAAEQGRLRWNCTECGISGTVRMPAKGSAPAFIRCAVNEHRSASPLCGGEKVTLILDQEAEDTANYVQENHKALRESSCNANVGTL